MKTLSSAVQTITDGLRASPIRVVTIEFSGLTLYLCDREWGAAGSKFIHDSQIYEPLIIEWGTIKYGRIDPSSFEVAPGEMTITIDNTTPVGGASSFVQLFKTHAFHFIEVTVSEFFDNAYAAADAIIIFKGTLENIRNMRQATCTLLISGWELAINQLFQFNIVDQSTYPSAKIQDIGKFIPQFYGIVDNAPFVAVGQGAVSTLISPVDDDDTTITLSDATFFSDSGIIVIGTEIIVYTGKAGSDLTGCVRGSWGTLAIGHKAGLGVGELISTTGASTNLNGNLTDSTSTITVDSTVGFPEVGVIQIETEQIIYKETSSTQFRYCTRGANNTIAATHNDNTAVYELYTTLIYIAEPVKAIDAVYVEGVRQSDNYTTYTGQTGDQHPSYGAKAVIEITGPPIKQSIRDSGTPASFKSISPSHGGFPWSRRCNFPNAGGGSDYYVLDCASFDINDFTSSYGGSNTWLPEYDPYKSKGGYTLIWWYSLTITNYGDAGTFQLQTADGSSEGAPSYDNIVFEITNGSATKYAYPPHYDFVDNGCPAPINGATAIRIYSDSNWDGDVTLTLHGVMVTLEDYSGISGDVPVDDIQGQVYFNGRVTADIQGAQDDASGTYTGTPNALINCVAHVIKHLLLNRSGLTADNIDSTTYALAEAYCSDSGYTVNFPILQRPNLNLLLQRIARQSRMISVWEEGKHKFILSPFHGTYTANKTIEMNRVDLGQIYMKYTSRHALMNTLTTTYDRDWSGYTDIEAERRSVTYIDDGSVSNYGTLHGARLSLPYVKDAGQAFEILEWTVMSNSEPRLIIESAGGWFLHDIERGDIIEWKFTNNDYLDEALLGMVVSESDQFQVIDMIRRPDKTLQIEMVEILVTVRDVNADNISTASSVTDAFFQERPENVISTASVTAPSLARMVYINANDTTTTTSITNPTLTNSKGISPNDIISSTSLTDGDIGWENINASNVISATTVTGQTLDTIRQTTASDLSSNSDVTEPILQIEGAGIGRGVFVGGQVGATVQNTMDYISISSTGNATDFGNLTSARNYLSSAASNTRGVIAGGRASGGTPTDIIDYITIVSVGNATDFGDLQSSLYGPAGVSSNTRGCFGGGRLSTGTYVNTIDYVTIATTGNGTDFGDLTVARNMIGAGLVNSTTRGCFGGGSTGAVNKTIDYITIATTGNATDFGDLIRSKYGLGACSSSTRGVWGGGNSGSAQNELDYITIASTGNASDFGDLSANKYNLGGLSSSTRGCFAGSSSDINVIDYITIANLGNSSDFGDLTQGRGELTGLSDVHGGL